MHSQKPRKLNAAQQQQQHNGGTLIQGPEYN